jgi:hypothetical protein
MIDKAFAEAFASEWISAWNSHDLTGYCPIMPTIEMASPWSPHRGSRRAGSERKGPPTAKDCRSCQTSPST